MLDIKLLREDTENVKKLLRKKHVDPVLIDNAVALDAEKRNLAKQVEELQSKRNKASKKIGEFAAQKGERTAPGSASSSEVEMLKKDMQFVKEQLNEIEPKLKKMEDELNMLLITIPNIPSEATPEGAGEEDNKVIKTVGNKPEFDFEPRDHVELGIKLDVIDIDNATNMSGARFYYLKNDAVFWEFALVQFVMTKLRKKGFSPVLPPVLVKERAMFGTGFFPTERNNIYHVNPEDDDLYLTGTSEVSLCMLNADKIIPVEKLPQRFAGFSTCFRREAGTYGKDTHGILRVHQFDKVEMFSFCHPDKSAEEHELIRSMEEEIMQDLGLHYQVVDICGGDLGAPAARKYDLEVWIPSQKRFRELTSCSNCTDFQARRCNIRFKDSKGNRIVHTLNGTAVAISRMLIAIMENFQQKDGSIKIPECLLPYLGK